MGRQNKPVGLIMKPSQKIKRDYKKPFFSSRRRGLSGIPLLIFALVISGISGGFILLTYTNYEQVLQTLRGEAPTPFASEQARQGIALYNAGQVDAALAQFELAVGQQPNNINYLYEYGRILIELDRYDEAAPHGDRAIEMAPDDVRGYALKARALMWSDPGTAIPVAVSGLEIDPNFAPLHAALAIAYTRVGRYAEGLQRGMRAVELDALDSFAHRAYSIPLIYTGRSSQAIEELEAAVAINPNLTGPYFELAAQYRAIDVPEMAVGIYQRILDIDSGSAKAYLRLCETYASIGEFITATGFCETALELDPAYASAWRMLGQLQYSRRNYESAIDSFKRCVEFGSTEVECYYIRGLAHYFLGQCDDAWAILHNAFQYTAQEQTIETINTGLQNVTINCPGYENRLLPTPIPPTPIPLTPIGGI